jgi:hypothetical protein
MKPGTILLTVVMFAILGVAIYFAWGIWSRLAGVEMSAHGWTALILGIVVSIALGAGLMFLVFYSHRKGYDRIDEE